MNYSITISNTNEIILCNKEETVLAALSRIHNKDITFGCFGGGCGKCIIQIIQGSYKKIKKMSRAHISEENEQNNIVLSCTIIPTSNLTIKIILP